MAKLHFYYSAMNAGKTTTLLQSDYNYRERGMQTLLFTPDFDNRYQEGWIASRIGLRSPAIVYSHDFNFFTYIKNQSHKIENLNCILIDEAHFLTKMQVQQLCQIVDQLDIPILAYGLRTDFMGEPFEGSKYLLALSEHLTEIKTICHCGRKATMNQRVNNQGNPILEGEQVEIGGNERYIALCRKHFIQT
ncbi:thymidine kinase [Candidatus Paracaedimonas acanthamoebae]|nr:thymidine kinase [Candidatus Paracaedimonas acanthamoebae]